VKWTRTKQRPEAGGKCAGGKKGMPLGAALPALLAGLLPFSPAKAGSVGFEQDEAFRDGGDIAAHAGWARSAIGAGKITGALSAGGSQSLEIPPFADGRAAVRDFAIPDDGIVFVDFSIRPAADAGAAPVSTVDAQGAALGFLATDGIGTVVAVPAPSAGKAEGQAVESGYEFAIDEQGAAAEWMRVTIREDLKAGKWDLFLDGRLVLVDQALPKNAALKKSGTLSFYASAAGPAYVDDVAISGDNPLFTDSDKDDIPDAVEMIEGTNPYFSDRDGDLNSDGKSNIRAFLAGASIGTPGTSKNAGRRIVYVDGRHGDDRFSGSSSYRVGGAAGNNGDGPKATLPEAIRENDADARFVLLPSDKPYVLVERAPGTTDTIYLIPVGDVSLETSKP